MTTPPPPSYDSFEREFLEIGGFITAVMETVRQGHMPDMSGLDKRIAVLCAEIEKTTPEIQQKCLPQLKTLLKNLDVCEEQVRAFHQDQIKAQAEKND